MLGGGTPPPPPTGPENNHFVNRITVPLPAVGATRTVTGSNVGGTAEGGEPIHAGKHSALNSVWWRYTPTASGPITIDTLGSNFDTVLAVYRGSSVASLVEVASNDDADYYTIQSQLTFNGTAGVEYQIAVAGYMNEAGNIRLSFHGGAAAAPDNDNFVDRRNINPPSRVGSRRTVTGSTMLATAERFEPYHAGWRNSRNSVWYRFTPQSTGRVTIDTRGSDFDTILAVYSRNSLRHLTEVASNNNTVGLGRQSRVSFRALAGRQYQIAITGYGNRGGNIRLNITGGEPVRRSSMLESASATGEAVGPAAPSGAIERISSDAEAQSGISLAATSPLLQRDVTARPSAGTGDVAVSFKPERASQPALTSSVNRVKLLSTVVASDTNGLLRGDAGESVAMLAVTNAGTTAARLTAELSLLSADGASVAMPVGLSICRTDALSGACIGSRATSIVFDAKPDEVITFAVFASGRDRASALDAGKGRLQVHFRQGDDMVGTANLEPDRKQAASSL